MNNPAFFNELQCLIKNNPKIYGSLLQHSKYQHLRKWIKDELPLLDDPFYTFSTKCFWILTGIIKFPICPTCHKSENFERKNVKVSCGYYDYCCNKCAQLSPVVNMHKKEGCMKNLGVEHPLQSSQCMQKFHNSCKLKFNIDHNFKAQSCIEKRTMTWLENYGYDHPMKSKDVIHKMQNNFRINHGVDNPSQLIEVQHKKEQTSLKHYGVKFPTQSKIVQQNTIDTCQIRYGVNYYVQSDHFKYQIKKKYFFNNIYFASQPEIALYIYLTDLQIQFEYQPNIKIPYMHQNQIHYYNPDFKIENTLYEIKGDQFFKDDGTMCNPYDHSQDDLYEAKHQCMLANNVVIMTSKQYKKYIKYIKTTYGKTYLNSFKIL